VPEIERVVRLAAGLAQQRSGRLTSVDKANVLETSRLWREVTTSVVSDEFPDVELEHVLVDAMAMHLIQRPATFDVVVTENMFGDILTDAASVLTGSLGMLPSASLGQHEGGLYEPIHGSAPDIAGRGLANPCGAIASVAMLVRHSLDWRVEADAIEAALRETVGSGIRTPDLGGTSSTEEVTQAITTRVHR
jgi:3-isopropylmalate dehydrogenase